MIKENPFNNEDDGEIGFGDLRPKTQEHQPVPPPKPRERYIWKDGKERAHRPMDFYLKDVLAKLDNDQVVIVQAETGVGKTTRIPQAILDSDPHATIYMTQTRRPAVRMNASFIAKEMGSRPGDTVGWQLRGEDTMTSDRTHLTVLIDQSLTNRILRERKLPEGYIIIDEAHERTVQIDILLALIKEYLPNSPKTKVLITSATIDTEKFKNFFNTSEPIIAQNEQLYPVEVYKSPAGEVGIRLFKGEHHTQGAMRAVREQVLAPWAKNELTIPGKKPEEPRTLVSSGTVLVLLPGKDDIQSVTQSIQREATQLGISQRIEVLQCHGQMQRHEQELVERPVPVGILRFVCATEIIRSSVTAPQVVGVVDSLQVKRHTTDQNGVTHLGKTTVSGAEADQGKGRAGREQPGFYIPVSFEGEYQRITNRQSREYWPQPAIQREALTSIILQIAAVNLSIRTLAMLDKPSDEKIDTAIKRLQKLGALDDAEEITELGETLVKFPIEPERARVLISAEQLGVLPETVIATAILENEGMQYVPRSDEKKTIITESLLRKILEDQAKEKAERNSSFRPFRPFPPSGTPVVEQIPAAPEDVLKNLPGWVIPIGDGRYIVDTEDYDFPVQGGTRAVAAMVWAEFAGDSHSDFTASITAYRAFKTEQRRLKDLSNAKLGLRLNDSQNARRKKIEDREMEWCKAHFINMKKLQFVENTVRDLREEIESSDIKMNGSVYETREYSSADLTKALLSGLVDNIAVHQSGGGYSGPMSSEIQVSSSSALSKPAPFILIGGVRKVDGVGRRAKTIHFADMCAPVEADWFMEVMPQLCRQDTLTNTMSFDLESGTVTIHQDTFYGTLKVKQERIAGTGEQATQVLAMALVEGKTELAHEKANREKTTRVKELLKRDRNPLNFDEKLFQWYTSRIEEATTVAAIQNLDLLLTDEVITELLEFDYQAFEARVLSEKPDTVELGGQQCQLTYYGGENKAKFNPFAQTRSLGSFGSFGSSMGNPVRYYVTLKVPVALIANFDWNQLPTLEGFDVELTLADKEYEYGGFRSNLKTQRSEEKSLSLFRENIEKRRQELVWDSFRVSKDTYVPNSEMIPTVTQEKFTLDYEQPLPPLPQPEEWDLVTHALAYPAPTLTHIDTSEGQTVWKIDWFQPQEKAEQANAQAEEARAAANAKEYEKRNFDTLVAEAQALYAEVQILIGIINFEDRELYGLTQEEASTDTYVAASLRGALQKASRSAGVTTGYRVEPTVALETLRTLKTRLEETQNYFNSKGREILQLRAEKEKLTAPEKPVGDPVLLIYRTTSGRLIASPAASLGSRREPELKGSEGTTIEVVPDEVAQQISLLIQLEKSSSSKPSKNWYLIPESGTYQYLEMTLSRSRVVLEAAFSVAHIPTLPGLYTVFGDLSEFHDPDYKPTAESIYPASYEIRDGEKRVALSVYDIAQYLEAQVNKDLPSWVIRRALEPNQQREVWYQANKIYERLKETNLVWVTPEQLAGENLNESSEITSLADPIDTLLANETRATTLGDAVGRMFVAQEVASKPDSQIDLSMAMSVTELRQIETSLQKQLGKTGMAILARLRLSMITEKLDEESEAHDRLNIEQELRTFAQTNDLTISETRVSPQQPQREPEQTVVREVAPLRLRADEYRELLASDIVELQRIVREETRPDQSGKWRLAVAALSTKGLEGRRFIIERKLKPETKEAVGKALDKIVSEASTQKRPDLYQIQAEVSQGLQGLEIARYLEIAQKHTLLNEYFEDDQDSRTTFLSWFHTALEAEKAQWNQLPPETSLDRLIERVIEEMTS